MASVEERLITLETEFRTELKHLATKADLKSLELRFYGAMLGIAALIVAVLRFWQ